MKEPLRIECFGPWSYAVMLALYLIVILGFGYYYRVILKYQRWWFSGLVILTIFSVLGILLEWAAGLLHVWDWPKGQYLKSIPIPLVGRWTGHEIPVEELLWIVLITPLFYFLFLWATLVFNDIVYVVDEATGEVYKREERWIGFFGHTHIAFRTKGKRGRENETPLLQRPPGFVARVCERSRHGH